MEPRCRPRSGRRAGEEPSCPPPPCRPGPCIRLRGCARTSATSRLRVGAGVGSGRVSVHTCRGRRRFRTAIGLGEPPHGWRAPGRDRRAGGVVVPRWKAWRLLLRPASRRSRRPPRHRRRLDLDAADGPAALSPFFCSAAARPDPDPERRRRVGAAWAPLLRGFPVRRKARSRCDPSGPTTPVRGPRRRWRTSSRPRSANRSPVACGLVLRVAASCVRGRRSRFLRSSYRPGPCPGVRPGRPPWRRPPIPFLLRSRSILSSRATPGGPGTRGRRGGAADDARIGRCVPRWGRAVRRARTRRSGGALWHRKPLSPSAHGRERSGHRPTDAGCPLPRGNFRLRRTGRPVGPAHPKRGTFPGSRIQGRADAAEASPGRPQSRLRCNAGRGC